MAVKLDREQQHTLAGILSVARKVRAPQKDILSAVETALVEANLRNPRSAAESGAGSGSSVGWRQETASSYPGVNRANVHGAAKRFFAELQKAPGGSSGTRAQAVQRSAYPGKYDEAKGQAQAVLRSYGAKRVHGALKDAGLTDDTETVSGTIPGSPNPVTPADSSLTDLLTQSLGQTPAVQAVQPAPLQVPNFSARYNLRTPSGAAPSLPESGPAQSQSGRSDAVLQALQQLGLTQDAQDVSLGSSPSTEVQGTVKGSDGGRGGSGGSSGAVRGGTVRLASGADRGGVSTQPITRKFVGLVAGATHRPVTITTGTNHNRLTVNGNVSDHWSGHAADIGVPVDSHQGDVIASAALQLAGVSAAQAHSMVKKGGLWTLTPKSGPLAGKRVQVIWRTMEGGNHHNHVHLGVR